MAYFEDKEDAHNQYTIGNADITLTEPNWVETGAEEAKDMYPGEAVAKDPIVKNDGKNPVFVRVKVTGMEDFTYRTDYTEGKLGDNWEYNEADGYFYYGAVLEVGRSTDALFDQVVLNTSVTNGDGSTKEIVVYAEAIQAQGAAVQWSRVEKMTVAEIANWFETKTQIQFGA